MSKPKIGSKIPTRTLPQAPKGKALVLYFYPRDMTSGCTAEGLEFKALHSDFVRAGAVVRGVSRDTAASHEKFRAKHGFPFELIADEDGQLCAAFDVIKQKSLYGRKYMGIERSSFLIGADGRLLQEWRKLKVAGHAAEVLAAAQALRKKKPRAAAARRQPATASKRRGAGR